MVLLLGAARSGTTWLAKVLDSHPDVLYRHEPDIALQDYSFPTLCEAADIAEFRPAATAYLDRLLALRTLKTMGGLPVFRKSGQGPLAPRLRLGLLLLLQAMQQVPPLRGLARGMPIPDFVDPAREPPPCTVVKSVSALGRAGLYAAAMPAMKVVLILRHPCGQVGSMLRGRALGKFEGPLGLGGSAASSIGQRYGLTADGFAALSPAEQHAWDWAVMNEFALEQLRPAVELKVIRYEDFCDDPMTQAAGLLAFAGLSWHPQTERFIAESTTYRGTGGYYQVFRNTRESANRWRRDLPPEVQHAIMAIASRTEVGRLFPESDHGTP